MCIRDRKKLNPQNGWLAERWHPNQKKRAKAAPYKEYKGDSHDAFWYFDKEIDVYKRQILIMY